MKKVFICLLVLSMLFGCSKKMITYSQPSGEIADMSGYDNLISEQFIKIDCFDAFNLVSDEKNTSIVYMGYTNCPWCQCLVPILNEVCVEKDMKVYYLDFKADENYYNPEQLWRFVDTIGDAGFLEKDEEDEYKIAMPVVVYIQQGKVIALHQGTVSGHDASSEPLSEKQKARLKYMLEKEFDQLLKVKDK